MARPSSRSTPTPASRSDAVPPRPALRNPPDVAQAKPVVLCPSCRSELTTYVTHHIGCVVQRYHRCGRCGLTALKTHQTPDGLLAFAGWAATHPCQTRPPPDVGTR